MALPAELRQPVLRHPVVLYTTTECSPCESGRQMLVTRGVPFNERRVGTEEDAQAFERLFGTRTLPLLTVGAQGLKGLSESEWAAYLDAAGYPRQSRMPRGWQRNWMDFFFRVVTICHRSFMAKRRATARIWRWWIRRGRCWR